MSSPGGERSGEAWPAGAGRVSEGSLGPAGGSSRAHDGKQLQERSGEPSEEPPAQAPLGPELPERICSEQQLQRRP